MERQSTSNTKVAFVVQRYGKEIMGGAESYVYNVTHRLANELGWEIDILTSCAKDYRTWKNEFSQGVSTEGNITVYRFESKFPRFKYFDKLSFLFRAILKILKMLKFPDSIIMSIEKFWFIAQGPYVPELVKHIQQLKDSYDAIYFKTYLYYPTIYGSIAAKQKAILIPTAHDEAPFYFKTITAMFRRINLYLALTAAEYNLFKDKFIDPSKKTIIITGSGIEPLKLEHALEAKLIQDLDLDLKQRYFLYLGRITTGKNVAILLDYYNRLINSEQNMPPLYLAGGIEEDMKNNSLLQSLEDSGNIKYFGFVTDYQKELLIKNSVALINPSPMESLSLITLEALSLEVPVLLNGLCPVLEQYAIDLNAAYSYKSYEQFKKYFLVLNKLNTKKRAEDTLKAKQWVENKYSWKVVLAKFEKIISSINK